MRLVSLGHGSVHQQMRAEDTCALFSLFWFSTVSVELCVILCNYFRIIFTGSEESESVCVSTRALN